MLLLAILNRLTDVGSELLSAEKMGAPTRYADIMPMLAKAGVINTKQAEALNKLIARRNVLAHFYGEVTSHDLMSMVKELTSVEAFLGAVKKRLAAQNKGAPPQDDS